MTSEEANTSVTVAEQHRRQTARLGECLHDLMYALSDAATRAGAHQLAASFDLAATKARVSQPVLEDLAAMVEPCMALAAYADLAGVDQLTIEGVGEAVHPAAVVVTEALEWLRDDDYLRETINFFIRLGRVMRLRMAAEAAAQGA